MQTNQVVRCPNCGSFAERRYFSSTEAKYSSCPGNQITQTECAACDYFMVMCSLSGSVLEAYAPGMSAPTSARKLNHLHCNHNPTLFPKKLTTIYPNVSNSVSA